MHFHKNKIDKKNLPRHIAIIMDGNGRWAKRHGLPRSAGHARGADNFTKISRFCGELGIDFLTVYAFSTENWKRPKEEVDELMRLLDTYIERAYKELDPHVRVQIIGERAMLSDTLRAKIEALEEYTKDRTGMVLNIALSYGGQQEILHALCTCVEDIENGILSKEEICEQTIADRLYTKHQPDPDLIIRPSGEKRISNFLLWQCAYAEFWYSDVLWPAFRPRHLLEAIADYQKRNRRFGGV